MNLEVARNVVIVLAIAAIVAFVPEGDESATFAGSVLTISMAILVFMIGMRLYQMFRVEIYGLGDRYRGLLYGSLGLIVLALAARPRLVDTDGGTLAFVALMLAAFAGLYAVWRRHRAHRV